MALITDLITRKQRNTIDHSRVACFCDTSSPNALAQCQAYYAAYPDLDPNLIFQYDLSTAGAKTRETAWELWGKDWHDFIVSNNIEGICCNPEFDIDSPLWPGYSALNVLGDILSLRRSMLVINPPTPDVFKSISPRVSPTPYSNSQYPYQFVGWYNFGGIRQDGPFPPPNPFVPESIISAEGDNAYDYTITGVVPENKKWDYSGGMLSGEWDFSRDYLGQKVIYIPTWRIGWKSGSLNPSEITTAEITAMVERSKSTKGSISSNIDKPIVTSSRQRVSNRYFIGQAMFTDTIFKDLGFTDVKWGYSKDQSGVSILNSYNTKLNTNNYDPDETSNTNVQFTLDNIAGTVGNQYRDLGPNYLVEDNYKWHAHNTNTFPMPVFTYVGGCLVNMSVNTNGSWCDGGADAVFDIQDGAVLFEMTSHFLQYAGWAIKNGASAVHGSYVEPFAPQVNSGGNFASNLLKGNQVATSAVFGMSSTPKNIEVWGDGLAAPYYYESTEEEGTMEHKKAITIATATPNDIAATTKDTFGYYGFGSTNPYAQRGGGSGSGRKYNFLWLPPASPNVGTIYSARGVISTTSMFLDYEAVAGDTQEDVVDGILASTYNNSAELENTFYFEKVIGPSGGDYAGQFGIQISGAAEYFWSGAMNQTFGVGTVNPTGWLASGVEWPKGKDIAGVDTLDNYYDKNGNIAFQFGVVNIASADRMWFVDDTTGWPNDTVTGFMLTGIDATDAASVISQYEGTTPKIEKITFKNISSPGAGIADIVLTREDFLPYVSQYSIYLLAPLSGVNGAAYRALPFIANNNYEATIEFSASDLGFSSGANKSVISRSVISHNTES